MNPEPGERPLHVRVAEALGTYHVLGPASWAPRLDGRLVRHCTIHGPTCGEYDFTTDYTGRELAPRYDTDWSATGPLIEKYLIDVVHGDFASLGPPDRKWGARATWVGWATANAPLIAVCHLLLALSAARKLELKP